MRRVRFGASRARTTAKPDVIETGNLEVESTNEATLLRFFAPKTGNVAEMTLDKEAAITTAAQLVFCALRHFENPDAAVALFFRKLEETAAEARRQAREGRLS